MKTIMYLCALLFACTLAAQNAVKPDMPFLKIGVVSGKVLDKNLQQPISYASIVIKSKADGSTITGGITTEDGTFEVKDIPEGEMIFEVQYIGYKTYSQEINITRRNRKIDVGSINLEEDVALLEDVEVVAERTTIEQKIDRKVINVGKDLVTAGPTASDIMNNIPSVSVDSQTGNISLRGNQNVQVMVDGKLSNVPAAQLLKQIPSTSIKSVELITNPSAKYNPEGMSGIINIVLHKNANIGFNGNLNIGLTYEEEAKFNSSIDMNYRNGKVNLYGNYGNNIAKNISQGNLFRVEENSEQFFLFLDNRKSHLFKAGIDFYLNDKNTISFFTNQNIFDGKTSGTTDIVYYDNAALNQVQLFLNENGNMSSRYNFDYKLDFATEGHNIELEVDYNDYEADEDADFSFTGASPIDDYLDFIDTERERTTINLDYVNPISKTEKLEIGAQARLFDSDIDYESTGESFNSAGNLVPTPSTQFEYSRDIYSAYVTYSKEYEKWSYQIGLRGETVEVVADTNTVSAFTNKYTQLYPSAFLTYKPAEKDQYQLSFSRRVDRPGLGQVNPIREWSTPLITSFGSTDLEPQFTNSIETNYTRRLKKGSITAGIFYRAIEDEINRALFVDRTNLDRVVLTFDNFDNTSAYGFELSSNYKPTKWWNFNASFDLYNQTQKGIAERLPLDSNTPPTVGDIITETVEVENTAWNFRMNNNFKVTKKLTFSLFAFYRGKERTLQFDIDPMYFVNTGMRYNFADGMGTFSLNYSDIFDSMKFAVTGNRPFTQIGEFNWESNTIYAGLSYRFGGGKYSAKKRKRRDSDEKSGSGGIF